MTDRALLPTGLEDVLPIDADFEAHVIAHLMETFRHHGYDRVKPPLIEFEENLLQGSGAAIASQTFRVMDPISQRMLGIRPDMTVQVERIATSRLINAPRPLRLSYCGQVLRVRGSQLRPERQFAQAGVELIGSDSAHADAEAILLAVEAMQSAGIKNLSVDLGIPKLIPTLLQEFDLSDEIKEALQTALERKDAAAIEALDFAQRDVFLTLLNMAGPVPAALDELKTLSLNGEAANLRDNLVEIYQLVSTQSPSLPLTLDPVEHRGYEYHSGVSYTFFAKGARGELGRGGRYVAGSGEPAAGVTLFVDSLMRALDKPAAHEKIYIPFGTNPNDAATLRQDGKVTVQGLTPEQDAKTEAKRIACTHIFLDGNIQPVG